MGYFEPSCLVAGSIKKVVVVPYNMAPIFTISLH